MAHESDAIRGDLLSVASLPLTPCHPSPGVLNWSDDLQAAFLTKQELFILTPACGFAVDIKNAQLAGRPRGASEKQADKQTDSKTIDWFKTGIVAESEVYWEHYTNDLRDTLISAQSPYWKMACWSPRGASQMGTCLLAALTSNAEVFIYAPSNVPHRAQWRKTFDLTLALHNLLMPSIDVDAMHAESYRLSISLLVQQWQVISIHWSPAPMLTSASGVERSLLATGHRSGHVIFWHLTETGQMEPIARIRPTTSWITNLQWSQWSKESDQKVQAKLAIGSADSKLTIMNITQDLSASLADPRPNFIEQLADSQLPSCIASETLHTLTLSSPVTALKWYDQETLIFSRLGIVGIYSHDVSTLEQRLQELELQAEGDWQGVNPWSPCTGIVTNQHKAQVLIALYDGSLHVLDMAAVPAPQMLYGSQSESAILTKSKRRLDVEATRQDPSVNVNKACMMRTFAVAALPTGELSWVSQIIRPDLLTYLPEGSQVNNILLSNLHLGKAQLGYEGLLRDPLVNGRSVVERSPLASTFPLQIQSRRNKDAENLDYQGLSQKLSARLDTQAPESQSTNFHAALQHFFQSDLALRDAQLKAYLALHLHLLQPGQASLQALVSTTTLKLAQILLSGLLQVFYSHNGRKEDLELLQSIVTVLVAADPNHFDGSFAALGVSQFCAACQAAIPFNHLRLATCENGHRWDRCSLSLQPIFSLASRSCTGCGRKYRKLPNAGAECSDSDTNGSAAGTAGMFEDGAQSVKALPGLLDIAKAVRVCIWCGGHTMSLR